MNLEQHVSKAVNFVTNTVNSDCPLWDSILRDLMHCRHFTFRLIDHCDLHRLTCVSSDVVRILFVQR